MLANSLTRKSTIQFLDRIIQFSLFTFVTFSMFSISVTQISFAIGALSWLLKVHLTRTWKEMRGTLVGIAILCFCVAGVLSIITSVDLENSSTLLKKLLQFVIFFWVANSIQEEKRRDLLVGLVILAGLAAALHGLLTPLAPNESRIKGTLSKEATFAGVLMLSGSVALGRFLFRKPKEYWTLGSACIIWTCLLLTLTRQAWLGFFIGAAFMLFFFNKKSLLVLPLFVLSLLLFANESLVNRVQSLTNFEQNSLQARITVWKVGWKIFKDYPITGCGYKCVDAIYSQYPDPSGLVARNRGMHSNVLQVLVDTGIVGLSSWALIWMTYFIEIFKRLRTITAEESQTNSRGILMGSSAAVLAYLVGGCFESSIYDSEVSMLLYFLMGLSLARVNKSA